MVSGQFVKLVQSVFERYVGSNPTLPANFKCTGSSVWTERRATNAGFARVQILLGVPFIVR